jgi:H+-transporting ATPase
LISLMDPLRADAKATIAGGARAGLEVKMVTGDDVAIGDDRPSWHGFASLVASDVFKGDVKAGALPRSVVDAGGAGRRIRQSVPGTQI